MNIIQEKQVILDRIKAGNPKYADLRYSQLSQSYLRAVTSMVGTTSQIPFTLQQNVKSAAPLSCENLLQLNDKFVITHVNIGLLYIPATQTPTALQLAKANVLTYCDTQTITTATAQNSAALFNGTLTFTINRTEYVPAFPMRAFLRVPVTQTNANLITDGTSGTPAATFTGNAGQNGYDNGLFGFYPFEPVVIDGDTTLDISVNLGTSVNTDDNTNYIAAVMEVRGYLIVNAKS